MDNPWNDVTKVPAPKDRVIEVTDGFHWEGYERHDKHANKTHRSWNIRGFITYAMWVTKEYTGHKDMWLDANGHLLPVPFTHWRETDNPRVGDAPFTGAKPPEELSYEFDGEPSRRPMLAWK
jgi:hypothetical protein